MSNNYNSTLQSNNTDLQAILNAINELPEASGDPVLQDKIITPSTSTQTIKADDGYDGLDIVTVNAMPAATQATPSITVNASGLITATATQTAGYIVAGTKSSTKQMTVQAAKTITPSTSSQTAVAENVYTTGAVTVAGDSNLVAGNIKSGVSIFGVAGSYEGSGGGAGVETSKVTIAASVFPIGVYYSPTLGEVAVWNADEPGAYAQFECVKGTIVLVNGNRLDTCTLVGCEYIGEKLVLVTDSVARIE